jgi:hypothetical protein
VNARLCQDCLPQRHARLYCAFQILRHVRASFPSFLPFKLSSTPFATITTVDLQSHFGAHDSTQGRNHLFQKCFSILKNNKMPSTLAELPVEIFHTIIDNLPSFLKVEVHRRHDLISLRQVCRTIKIKTRMRFGDEYLHGIVLVATPSHILLDDTFRHRIIFVLTMMMPGVGIWTTGRL